MREIGTTMWLHIEIKGHELPKGSVVRLFDESLLHQNWTEPFVAAIQRSVKMGTWQKVNGLEIRATKVRSKTGWKKI